MNAEVVYTGPVQAPIEEGQQLAELVISPDGLPEIRRPLVAQNAVGNGGFLVRIKTAVHLLVERVMASPVEAS